MSLQAFLALGLILFSLGLYAVLARRNLIAVLLGVELMLNASTLNFLAFNSYLAPDPTTGQVVALVIIGLAAAEVAIALAIILAVYRQRRAIDTDELTELKG